MSNEKCYIYELSCKDPRNTDKYLGYTTELRQCMTYHKEKSEDQEHFLKSTLYFEIYNHGGWKNWSYNVLEIVKGRKEAIRRKLEILQDDDGLYYTLNTHVKSLKPAYIVNPDNSQTIL
jgi:hypothetical protein